MSANKAAVVPETSSNVLQPLVQTRTLLLLRLSRTQWARRLFTAATSKYKQVREDEMEWPPETKPDPQAITWKAICHRSMEGKKKYPCGPI